MNDGAKKCSRCGAAFTCDIAAGRSTCWCFALPHVPPAGKPEQDCLCPQCLAAAMARENSPAKTAPQAPPGNVRRE
ncbi:MAG: cysteine-rich CWC family protein [Verrucomicrobia bacterium]|nr:cysteine-rich CWC family protein [Verrucomicrobiota bacterium]